MRGCIENTLMEASWVEKVRELLGISGISQVWGNKPAWYLWIKHAKGVYRLELEHAFAQDMDGTEAVTGSFSLKCYPYPGGEVFEAFSPEERGLVSSEMFDTTNTPCFEHREAVPEPLFTIAGMELTAPMDHDWRLYSLESLDRMRLREAKDTAAPVRNVPALELAYPLFDCLVSLYANHSKTRPARAVVCKSQGFEYVREAHGGLTCVDAAGVDAFCLGVLFAKPGASGRPDLRGLARLQCAQGETLFDHTFSHGHFHGPGVKLTPSLLVPNDLWWALADANFKSELGSACGCDHCS